MSNIINQYSVLSNRKKNLKNCQVQILVLLKENLINHKVLKEKKKTNPTFLLKNSSQFFLSHLFKIYFSLPLIVAEFYSIINI